MLNIILEALRDLRPETVIAWHRKGWRLWRRLKSQPQTVGRPRIPYEVIELIRRLFRTLYIFVVLSLDRRRIVHLNVTTHPTAAWTASQLYQAFPFDAAPRFLVRDRDHIYGAEVQQALHRMNIAETVISARSPWQNGYCERVVGTLKRECLNHMIVFNEAHARRILKQYLRYYHGTRTHLGLGKDTPDSRPIEPPELGFVKRQVFLGGLHSRYYRTAA
jgi:transposase InsO family protein